MNTIEQMWNKEYVSPIDIFMTVAKHLFKQDHRAFAAEYEFCVYRTENNEKCAVGCLIPDSKYSDRIEELDIYQLLDGESEVDFMFPKWMHHNRAMLKALQVAHDTKDNWKSTDIMKAVLQHIAAIHGILGITFNNDFKALKFTDR